MTKLCQSLIFLLFICASSGSLVLAQSDDDLRLIYQTVDIDSITVIASKNGFDVEDFIELAIRDTTFYSAFQNLRTAQYSFNSKIDFLKKNKVKAHLENAAVQRVDSARCRSMDVISEESSGNLYKNGSYRYFTMKMFAKAFYTQGRICTNQGRNSNNKINKSKKDKYYSELKKLIFFPDQKISVPMMGQRTQIYSKQMQEYYNYKIESEIHSTGVSCYSFTAKIKPKYTKLNQRKNTVIKYLKLYFSKEDFQVLGKEYDLAFNSGLYKFDITMDIQLGIKEGHYYPSVLIYDGYWKIPFKKKEKSRFELHINPDIEFLMD